MKRAHAADGALHGAPPRLLGVAAPGGGRGRVVIVGGGVSGLVAAWELSRHGREVVLFEASSRLGGNLRTERVGEFLLDVGADSFLASRPEAVELCRELGLAGELITPRAEGRGVYVAHDGALVRLPEGLSLGVPLRLGSLLESPLLSPEGKLRALCEPFVPARNDPADESIASFARRRLGREMAERIAAPLLAGIVAGDPDRLSMRAAFPQLVLHERRFGSLLRGMLGGKSLWQALPTLLSPPTHASPFVSFEGGLSRLVERLVEQLPESVARTNTPVSRVERAGAGFVVHLEGGEAQSCDVVILALPPWHAARLVPDAALAGELAEVRYSSTATVFFGFDVRNVERTLDASGFIVPEGEGDILASTWCSAKWAGRAPRGSALVRAFVGGARHPEHFALADEALEKRALAELCRLMGHLGEPLFSRVHRYPQGNPQPELGHEERLARMAGRIQGIPGLFLIGAGFGGVGVPDCVRQARAAVRVLLEGGPSAASSSGVV